MSILDVNFTKLEAKRKTLRKPLKNPQIKINNNTKISNIEKRKMPTIGEALVVDFEYTTQYDPDIGRMSVGGTVLYHSNNVNDDIEKKKGKLILKPKAHVEVQNAIIASSTVQALLLAKEVKLPPPVQLPKIVMEGEESPKGYA